MKTIEEVWNATFPDGTWELLFPEEKKSFSAMIERVRREQHEATLTGVRQYLQGVGFIVPDDFPPITFESTQEDR